MRTLQPFRNRRELSAFRDMRKLMSQFDDLFGDFTQDTFYEKNWPSLGVGGSSQLKTSVDIEENNEMYLISADLPGMKKENIKIDVSGNTLRLSGEKHIEKKEEGYYERSSGQFCRSFTLPEAVDEKKIEANFEDGVLRVVIPKMEVKAVQNVKIQSGQPQGLVDRFLNSEKSKH